MKEYRRLAATLILFSCTLLSLAACRKEPVSPALPATPPSPTVAVTTPTLDPAVLPDGAELLQRSQESMMALPALGIERECTTFLSP